VAMAGNDLGNISYGTSAVAGVWDSGGNRRRKMKSYTLALANQRMTRRLRHIGYVANDVPRGCEWGGGWGGEELTFQ
jgi:hypothetical protein